MFPVYKLKLAKLKVHFTLENAMKAKMGSTDTTAGCSLKHALKNYGEARQP
jgi:hypothetical protein